MDRKSFISIYYWSSKGHWYILHDVHSITNEIYLPYFTFDSLKHILPYYFYLVERFLKLSSNFVRATTGMSCDVNIMGFICASFYK